MTMDSSRRRRQEPAQERQRFERDHSAAGRESALLFVAALAVFVLVAAVSVRQATAPGSAIGVIEDGVAATTEVDLLLAQQLPALREQARKHPGEEAYALPGYPVEVFLTGEELLKLDQAAVRELLLRRSAHAVYDQGLKAFDRTGNQQVSFLSLQGQMDLVLGNLTSTRHSQAGVIALVAGLVFAGAAVGVLLLAEGHSGFRKLGLAVVAGTGFGLMLSGLAWFGAGLFGGNDPFVTDLRDIVRSLLGVPIRDYLVVLVAGLLASGLSPLAGMLVRLTGSPADTDATSEPADEPASVEDWEPGAPA
ncbi:MAG: hypothetical protein HS107_09265 [Thermoflexaceae bacterium]|nr:hypothetical protein [Thermoflexaceae bacterium]